MTDKPAGNTHDQGADRSADRKPREVRGDPSVWQPIETIPRDGKEPFLVRYQSGHVEHVYLTEPVPPLVQSFRYFGGPLSGQQAGWPDYWMRVPSLDATALAAQDARIAEFRSALTKITQVPEASDSYEIMRNHAFAALAEVPPPTEAG